MPGDLVKLFNCPEASNTTNRRNLSDLMIVLYDSDRNDFEKEDRMMNVYTSIGCKYIHSEYIELVQSV